MFLLNGPQTYPTNASYVAAGSSELGAQLLPRTMLGQPIVLFRDLGQTDGA